MTVRQLEEGRAEVENAYARAVAAMRRHPEGADALIIGRVVDDHRGRVISKTALGSNRIIDTHVGDQFPRIC